MKNPDKIGWGLIKSCMSDQASTQKLSTVGLRREWQLRQILQRVVTERCREGVETLL